MHKEHVRMRLEKRRPNHHSTHSDGTPRRPRPTRTVARGRNRATTTANATSSPLATSSNIQTQVAAVPTTLTAVNRNASPVASTSTLRSSATPSLPIVVSSSRSSSVASSSSSGNISSSASIANAEASAAAQSTTPNNANKYIPAILASLFVVLAAALLIFCLHRRRKLARKRDALTSLAPSPYKLDGSSDPSIDEKGYAYGNDEKAYYNNEGQETTQHYLNQDPAPAQANYAGRPGSFLQSIRNTFLRRKSTRTLNQPESHPWDWQASNAPRAESPPIPKVPVLTQVPSTTHDPFRDGFGPGASQLATGLANSTMTSQTSSESHCSLSHKQSLSSNASTSVARRWPNGIAKDGHESLSQGPNVRTLYTGVQVEREEDDEGMDDAYADAYGYAMSDIDEGREELAMQTPSMQQAQSIRTVSYASRADEQGRHLSQSTDGRSIRFGTLRSQSDTGEELIEPAWQRN